jgi:hypothetical protein
MMRTRKLGLKIGLGVGLALAGSIPATQAKAPVADRPVASLTSSRAMRALDARWSAEAARFYPGRAVIALDARWNAEARSLGRP